MSINRKNFGQHPQAKMAFSPAEIRAFGDKGVSIKPLPVQPAPLAD